MRREFSFAALEAGFLKGEIVDKFLPMTAAGGFDDFVVHMWSTPVCGWAKRHTLLICPTVPITRDPTTCENKR
jgi:hypothetical protein